MNSSVDAAVVILASLGALALNNVSNVIRGSRRTRGIERKAEVNPPSSRHVLFVLAGLSTLLLFVFCGLFVFLIFFGLEGSYPFSLMQIQQSDIVRTTGVTLFVVGSALFIWSVLARGRYSVSWAMPVDQKLVTWGPYKYIRHPSYTGYFLMFIGLFLTWLNLLAIIPLLGIPGYVKVSQREEEMLVLRFGNTYLEYRKKTGSFVPRL